MSSGPELAQDVEFRRTVLQRISRAPWCGALERFPRNEVAPIANSLVGKMEAKRIGSEAYNWLFDHPSLMDFPRLAERLRGWRRMNPFQVDELLHLLHSLAPEAVLLDVSADADLYAAPGPRSLKDVYATQAEAALQGLANRARLWPGRPGLSVVLLRILRALPRSASTGTYLLLGLRRVLEAVDPGMLPRDPAYCSELVWLLRQLVQRLAATPAVRPEWTQGMAFLNSWVERAETAVGASAARPAQSAPEPEPGRVTRRRGRK